MIRRLFLAVLLIATPFGFIADEAEDPDDPKQVLASADLTNRQVVTDRASRSSDRTMFPPAVPELNTPATTTTTTTTTTPPKRTTTTIVKRPTTTTTTTAKPKKEAPAPVNGSVSSIAIAQKGKAYVRGANGPNAFDCSGLVYYVFNAAGIKVPRLTDTGYYAKYPHISRAQLQPGDLAFYGGHVAIYVGNGQIVAASTPRGGVKHYGIDAPGRPYGFARIS